MSLLQCVLCHNDWGLWPWPLKLGVWKEVYFIFKLGLLSSCFNWFGFLVLCLNQLSLYKNNLNSFAAEELRGRCARQNNVAGPQTWKLVSCFEQSQWFFKGFFGAWYMVCRLHELRNVPMLCFTTLHLTYSHSYIIILCDHTAFWENTKWIISS